MMVQIYEKRPHVDFDQTPTKVQRGSTRSVDSIDFDPYESGLLKATMSKQIGGSETPTASSSSGGTTPLTEDQRTRIAENKARALQNKEDKTKREQMPVNAKYIFV